jgi:FixJ family two-component response regulator
MVELANLVGALPPLRVHVVDPDDSAGRSLAALLQAIGMLSVFGHSTEAFLSSEPEPGFILVDPGRTGAGALAEISRLMEFRWPVIVMSASLDREFATACLERGAAGYLDKPFWAHDLINLLRAAGQTFVGAA